MESTATKRRRVSGLSPCDGYLDNSEEEVRTSSAIDEPALAMQLQEQAEQLCTTVKRLCDPSILATLRSVQESIVDAIDTHIKSLHVAVTAVSLSGHNIVSLDMPAESTVGILRCHIAKVMGVSPWRLDLVFGASKLDMESTLAMTLRKSSKVVVITGPPRLATASADRTAKIWRAGMCIHTLEGHTEQICNVEASKDGDYLVSSCPDEDAVMIWNAGTGERLHRLPCDGGGIINVNFSRDGTYVITVGDFQVRIWIALSGQLHRELFPGDGEDESFVSDAVFSPDCRLVATAHSRFNDEDNVEGVRIWNIDGHCLRVLEAFANIDVEGVRFSEDSSLVISDCMDDFVVRIANVGTGECVQTLRGHTDRVWCAVFSKSGIFAVTACGDHYARLFSVETGDCLQKLEGHNGSIRWVVFSHDDAYILTASVDHSARIWSSKTGECLKALKGHTGMLNHAIFSDNSSLVATASSDCSARLWDAETGECLQTLRGHDAAVMHITFVDNC